MKTNPMKTALAEGRTQIGTWINFSRNPAVLTLLQSAGLDYARIDMEHSSPSIETIADMAVLGRALDFPIVVRPPEGNREWITRLLDVGVWGLHVPGVENAERAHEIVQAARYAPLGMRGQSSFGPNTDFDPAGWSTAGRAEINANVHLTLMLESVEAFEQIDEIVGMEGVDAVTLGPSDLAQALGVTGTPDEKRVIDEYRLRLIAAANRLGKDVAMLVQTLEEGERWIREGAKIIAYSSDARLMFEGFQGAAKRLKAAK